MKKLNLTLLHATIFLFSMVLYLITIDWFLGLLSYVILYVTIALMITLNKDIKAKFYPHLNVNYLASFFLFGVMFFLGLYGLGFNQSTNYLYGALQNTVPLLLVSTIAFTYILMIPIKYLISKNNQHKHKTHLSIDILLFIINIVTLVWMIFYSPVFVIGRYAGLIYMYGLYVSIPTILIIVCTKIIKLYQGKKVLI